MKKVIILCTTLILLMTVVGTTAVLAGGNQGQSGKSSNWHVNTYEKNPADDWSHVVDGAWGRLNCKITEDSENPGEFNITGVFNGHGLVAGTEYTLVNYQEEADGIDWSTEDPIVHILGFGTVNDEGDIHLAVNGSLGERDTMPTDVGDYQGGMQGEKIWLVLTSDISDGMMIAWNPDSYLFEDILINTSSAS